jgi:hypothetical protein
VEELDGRVHEDTRVRGSLVEGEFDDETRGIGGGGGRQSEGLKK